MTDGGAITLDEARRREADRALMFDHTTDATQLPADEDDYGADAQPSKTPTAKPSSPIW